MQNFQNSQKLYNSINDFGVLNTRVDGGLIRGNPQFYNTCFDVRDIRVLHDNSIFEEYDALRKSYQYDKDFITDQDSIAGPNIINNMIKNILCTKLGSLSTDPNFGVDLTYHLFEQLDWVGIIAIRDHIANQLDTNLPSSIEVETVDVRANTDGQANAIDIDIVYHFITDDAEFKEVKSGPGSNLNTKKVMFTLGVDGFTGFEQPNRTQFRRAI